MNYINTTPHPITKVDKDGFVEWELPKSDNPLRLEEEVVGEELLDGVAVTEVAYKSASLPEVINGSCYIVALPLAMMFNRHDFLVVDPYRNDQGHIIGAQGFKRVKSNK